MSVSQRSVTTLLALALLAPATAVRPVLRGAADAMGRA